jgi:hypothetical protein
MHLSEHLPKYTGYLVTSQLINRISLSGLSSCNMRALANRISENGLNNIVFIL